MIRSATSFRELWIAATCCASLGSAAAATAAEPVHPIKISQAQVGGQIFEDYQPVVKTEGGNTTHDVEVFLTKDRKFDAGMDPLGESAGRDQDALRRQRAHRTSSWAA